MTLKKKFIGKISRKITISMLLVSLIPLSFAGYFSYMSSRDILIDRSLNELENDVKTHALEVEMMLNNFGNNIMFIANIPSIQGIIRTRNNNEIDPVDGSTYTEWTDRMGIIFEEIAKSNSAYLQVRYLDENGQELVRVDSNGIEVIRKPNEQLQNKGDRYYFTDTMKIGRGELFISPLDLNREGSPPEIEIPHKPVIRYGTPVFDEITGEPRGTVIINIKAESFLSTFHTRSNEKELQEFFVNKDGYYFLNPEESKEWGSPRDLNTGENVKKDFENNMTSLIFSGESGAIDMSIHNHVLAYHPVYPNSKNKDNFWIIFEIIPRSIVLAPIFRIGDIFIITAFVLGFLVIFSSLFFSWTLTKPIIELTKMAKSLSAGNLFSQSKIRSNDEIGVLAEAFNKMVLDVKQSRANVDKKVASQTWELAVKRGELENQQKAVLNILEDVEQEKGRVQVLAQDLEKFKLAVENASDHIVITDAEGIVLYANKAVERITGFKKEEVIGQKSGTKNLWGGLMKLEFYKKMWQTIKEEKKTFKSEINNKRKGGEKYIAAVSITPILNDQSQVVFFVGIERDITQEKLIDQAKTEFVSLASHQLRTPLSTIRWYAEILLDGDAGKLNDQQKEYMGEIYKGNLRMVELVGALLNVSRLELGTFAIDPEMILITEISDIVIKELQPKINEKKIKFTKEYDKDLEEMSLDKKLTDIIFQNLLSNAVKYTPEGGEVGLKISKEKEVVKIIVADTGLGIPKAQQKNIFEKLFRADNVKIADTEGTGLGLYIVKSILDQSGGKIWFESPSAFAKSFGETRGATFYVEIPLSGMKSKKGTKVLN